MQTQVHRALQAVRSQVEAFATGPDAALYAPGEPHLVVVTSLAEGADRLVADAAMDLRFALSCPLPFPREIFVLDFEPPVTLEPQSRERFESLLQRAHDGAGLTVFELDGEPGPDTLAYAQSARVVVAQSDILIAVWDGAPAAGAGGTPESVLQALRAGVPVIWVDARPPFGWRVLHHPEQISALARGEVCEQPPAPSGEDDELLRLAEQLGKVIANELAPPRIPTDSAAQARVREAIVAYQSERRPRVNVAFAWKLFRDLVAHLRWSPPRLLTRDYVEQIAADWAVRNDAEAHDWITARLRTAYAWADKSADRFADLHRSGFVMTSFLTPLAVFIAVAPGVAPGLRDGPAASALMAVEGVLVIFILMLMHAEQRGRWHANWMERRLLAELIRQLRLVTPVGGGRARPRPQQHLSVYGDPAQSWMSWSVRAIERDLGLPDAQATAAYARRCLDDLSMLVAEQQRFHTASVQRAEAIHRRLHRSSLMLFWLTVAGSVVHLLTPTLKLTHPVEELIGAWLLLGAVFCPALGAALASVNNQGEFQRLAKRSLAMKTFFESETHRIRSLAAQATTLRMSEVKPLVLRVGDVMVDEVMDWRVVVADRASGV